MSPQSHARSCSGTILWLVALFLLPVMQAIPATEADAILRAGPWEGTYQPPKSGDPVVADFKVEKGENGEERAWVVSMSLRLPAPVNRPRAFLEIESDANELRFMVDMNPSLACRLQVGELGELSGDCYENAWGEGPSGFMIMKPPTPIVAEGEAAPAEPE
jgi:hypothetical protein